MTLSSLTVKEVMKRAGVTEDDIKDALKKRYIEYHYPHPYSSDYEIQYNTNLKRYIEQRGDTTRIKKIFARRGRKAFVCNKIWVWKYSDGKNFVFTAFHPDGQRRAFEGRNEKNVHDRAYAYCYNIKDYCVRETLSFAGKAQQITLTKYNLLYLLQLVPKTRSNKFLIGKLENALINSRASGRNFGRENGKKGQD